MEVRLVKTWIGEIKRTQTAYFGNVKIEDFVWISLFFFNSLSTFPPASCHKWYTSVIVRLLKWSVSINLEENYSLFKKFHTESNL